MEVILKAANITKRYPGVVALDNVSLSFDKGEIHALVGENGAGKSTLIKLIAGAETPDGGTFTIDGKAFYSLEPIDAINAGISVVYQEPNLVLSLSVAENLFLGKKVGKSRIRPDFREMNKRACDVLSGLGANIRPETPAFALSAAQRQLVEIAKAIVKNCKVLIMDEPSATLSMADVENLLRIVRELKTRGITIIYVSHRIDEVFRLCDRVSILRDGRHVITRMIDGFTRKDMIRHMVGREVTGGYPEREYKLGQPVLEARDLTGNGDFNIRLTLHRGEILGIAGLVGAGRSELAKMLCGDVRPVSGEVVVRGIVTRFDSVAEAVGAGIGLIPEDRKTEGLFMDYSVAWNIAGMSLKRLAKFGIVRQKRIDELSESYIRTLGIKTPSVRQNVRNLSGGNQQKVVVSRVLAAQADILIFDEPTRGIDVGARHEIHSLMNGLTNSGKSVILISSDMEELLGMSDRIVVLHEGKLAGELRKNEFSQIRLLEMASGDTKGLG